MNNSNTLPEHHFFVLSKGYNAGKPLEKPCPNCFIVTADSLEELGKVYWICYALWKCGIYLPLLCGSVIPFLHIKDIAAEIEKSIQKVNENTDEFDLAVHNFQHLIRTERLLDVQLKLINKIKSSIARKLLTPR